MNLRIFLFFTAALFYSFIYTVFKKELGQRFGMKQLRLAVVFVLQLQIEIFQQLFRIADNDIMHRHLRGFPITDHRKIHRYGNSAVRIHIQSLQRFFRIRPPHGNHTDLHIFRRIVIDTGNTDLVLFRRFFNGSHQTFCGGRRRNFTDHQFPAVDLDLGTQNDLAVAVFVFPGIHQTALLEVRVKFKRLSPQSSDLRLEQFIEVVRHDTGRHTHGDTIASQHQQTGDLDRQNHRFFTAAVIGIHQFRDLI